MFTKRMLMGLLIVALALAALAILPVGAQESSPPQVGLRPDAPTYALHGPYWVGTMRFEAETVTHPTTVIVWYPALNPDAAPESVTYDLGGSPVFAHAIQDASPDSATAPYPPVVFAHGANGALVASTYLTEHLASQGFVVIAISFADNWPEQRPIEDKTPMFTRPQDVSWTLDYAETLTADEGALAGMIDMERVAVVGHSYGGETALLAAGARIDLGPDSWCGQYPDTLSSPESGSVPFCPSAYPGAIEAVAKLAGLETAPEGLWPSWADARIDAIVPLAPGLFDFSSQSFSGVTVPTLAMVGSSDHWVHADSPLYMPYAYDDLGSQMKARVVFENGDHLIFSNTCDAYPWLVDMGAYFFCSDPVWDMDRAHDLVNHFTTAFLLDMLKGDKDAHTALLAENVSFPGITYETTMQ